MKHLTSTLQNLVFSIIQCWVIDQQNQDQYWKKLPRSKHTSKKGIKYVLSKQSLFFVSCWENQCLPNQSISQECEKQ
jgi:hypothetical protein